MEQMADRFPKRCYHIHSRLFIVKFGGAMLSNVSRFLTYACALLYGILGALLFFLPAQLAPVFAWKVTAFMTITIGGWCLGNAWLAYVNARRWLITSFSNFDMGLGTMNDIFEAFERYGTFRGDYLMALYNYNVATAQLDKATGAYRRTLAAATPPPSKVK
jgi:hypothetical protein